MAKTETAKLISARVTNFGCFCDSGDVPIDDVTALIAENENGKTTFLRALAWWDNSDGQFDEEDRWDGADKKAKLELVALTFELSTAAKDALREAGVAKIPKDVRIIRDTAGEYTVFDLAGEEVVTRRGPARFNVDRDALADHLQGVTQVPEASDLADQLRTATLGSGIAETTITKIRDVVLPALPEPAEQAPLTELIAQLEAAMADPAATAEPEQAITVLDQFLPQLLYYDETVDFVADAVAYGEVEASPQNHRTMINLATITGNDLVEVAKAPGHTRQSLSHDAQETLSTTFSKYWQGDPVTVYTQFDETQMTLTIEHKGRKQRPSRRSSGLKWQLGFFVNFKAEVKGDLSGAVLLLDEPGLHLHIKQQPKLLELFDDLAADGCRLIYATHLSHMLAPDKPHRFRPLVADDEHPDATRVVPNIMSVPSKSDVMQPVRQALGMGIADAIGLGGTCVVAEGWAERYVLLEMRELCNTASLKTLSAVTTVLPAGGSGKKTLPFAAMAVAEKASAVVLVDDDNAGRSTVTLIEKTLPNAIPTVRTHEEAAQTNRELEDLFEPEYYLGLVNDSHKDVKGYRQISLTDIDTGKPICDEIGRVFKAQGLGSFQKLRPAMELQKRRELGEAPDKKTLAKFSDLFERLTSALKNG